MTEHADNPGVRLDRNAFTLVFRDDFTGEALDPGLWVDHYLPHWSTPDRSAARYELGTPGGLRLLIEADQPAWRPEDGAMRVSNVQTGTFSGPQGSELGQHRHRTDLQVRTPQPTRRLWTPTAGLVEATLRASRDSTCMLGIWLVGFEEGSPEDSGEICLAELFGDAIGPDRSQVRLGIKAHHDPRLRTDMHDLVLGIHATEEHRYAAEWDSAGVRFYVDDVLVLTSAQHLDYPLQLMVDLFEFPDHDVRDPVDYPKVAYVSHVRGYERQLSAEQVIDEPERIQFEVFLDEHRAALNSCLDGLTEEQARRSLVPSRTTLLGLVKHATFVEKVWFDEAVTCRSRAEIGIGATPDESFVLSDDDTIASVQRAHREACEASRHATALLELDHLLLGNRRGPIPLRWVYLHMLRELAQHCGHADILREQLLAE